MSQRVAPRSVAAMHSFVTTILRSHGAPPTTADPVARHMLWADRRGTETHGLVRLPAYVERVRRGTLDPTARPHVEARHGAVTTVDANHGFGHAAADYAMNHALERSRSDGVGVTTVRRSGHFGAAGAYAAMAATQGAVGIAMTNAAPLMAPTGGRERRVGNNPIAVAVPFSEFPIVLDIAMSAVAAGRVMLAARRGESIPDSWGADRRGRPTTDPHEVLAGGGLLRPVADHKGYGLALVVDLLTSVLGGGAPGIDVKRLDQDGPVDASHTCIALDVSAFGDPTGFADRIEALAATMRATPLADGAERVLLPGEREAEVARRRDEHGIDYPDDIFAALERLAADVACPLPPPAEMVSDGVER
ncbi:Ldh family oxidoreductase [Spiractinospora alimapuensis]|uniref:Ldh family oxidoreductase n=1 Tax=Spiractinospora alimapuensis TaxID=2820884 RepID=UPI001F161FC4|nr:Ldh family oxidoreductase [Spiractinospora alimapuensis]QVQ53041.1 Ldh family oxidoreductase [Spiractinospora alimapuensis]